MGTKSQQNILYKVKTIALVYFEPYESSFWNFCCILILLRMIDRDSNC